MYELGFLAWVAGGILAVTACDPETGRRTALVLPGVALACYLVALSLSWIGHVFGHEMVQLGLVITYGLIYGLTGAGLVRAFVRESYAPLLACGIAALMPVLGWILFALLGDDHNPVTGGMGHLSDLLFLDPIEMGEGVRRDGFIPHRFRVHYLALGSALLLAVGLQLLPPRSSASQPA